MTTLLNTRHDFWNEESFVELEYLIGELFASAEFSLLVIVIFVWAFLRVYWIGIRFYARITGQDFD